MRKVFQIGDGGGLFWYSAETEDEARALHNKFVVEPSGEPADIDDVIILSDGKLLTIHEHEDDTGNGVTRTAKEWAELESGFLATTEY